jgi:uncharacterized protein YjbI with pentapeptide repeats
MRKATPPRRRQDALEPDELDDRALAELVEEPEQGGIAVADVTIEPRSLDTVTLDQSVLARVVLAGVSIRTRLDTVDLRACDLANSGLEGSWWYDLLALDCRLTGTVFVKARLDRVTFDRCAMTVASFREAALDDIAFVGCDLQGVDLSDAQLRNVRFDQCELDGFVARGTTFEGVDFSGSQLGSSVPVSDLRGATIDVDQAMLLALQLTERHGVRIKDEGGDEGRN